MFSSRFPKDLSPNSLGKTLEQKEGKVLDLTLSNPTLCGFESSLFNDLVPRNTQVDALYHPEPLGVLSARKAVSDYLKTRGLDIEPSSVFLAPGTSEAFSYVLKLLGDPGDKFLIPSPGYPLFEILGRLEGIQTVTYQHRLGTNWPLDRGSLPEDPEGSIKGLISVSPQNPTGCSLSSDDLGFLEEYCGGHGIAFLLDEVFSEYGDASLPQLGKKALTFRFGGLSKSLALPQLKLSWTVVQGPKHLVQASLDRLEFIADAYLSLSQPIQNVLPGLFEQALPTQERIRQRIAGNRALLSGIFEDGQELKVWPSPGGWSQLLEFRFPGWVDHEMVETFVRELGVLVHPGVFYEIPSQSFIVVSLLVEPGILREGCLRIKGYLERRGKERQGHLEIA